MASVEVTDTFSAFAIQPASARCHVNRLPLELLDEVFSLVVMDRLSHSWGLMFTAGIPVHGALTLVCRKWRDTVRYLIRHPWNFTTVHLGPDCLTTAMKPDHKEKMVSAILAFSGSDKLDVTLDFCASFPTETAWIHYVLVQARRFHSLTIRGDLRDEGVCQAIKRLHYDSRPKDDVALRRLTLEHIPRADSVSSELSKTVLLDYSVPAPLLSEVYLEGPMSSYLVSPRFNDDSQGIRKLVCKDFGIVTLCSLLGNTGLSTLEELDWDRRPSAMPTGEHDYAENKLYRVLSSPGPRVTMHHLKKITLRNAAYALRSEFFDNVSLPAVKEITLDDIELKDDVVDAMSYDSFGERRRTGKFTVNCL